MRIQMCLPERGLFWTWRPVEMFTFDKLSLFVDSNVLLNWRILERSDIFSADKFLPGFLLTVSFTTLPRLPCKLANFGNFLWRHFDSLSSAPWYSRLLARCAVFCTWLSGICRCSVSWFPPRSWPSPVRLSCLRFVSNPCSLILESRWRTSVPGFVSPPKWRYMYSGNQKNGTSKIKLMQLKWFLLVMLRKS